MGPEKILKVAFHGKKSSTLRKVLFTERGWNLETAVTLWRPREEGGPYTFSLAEWATKPTWWERLMSKILLKYILKKEL